MFTHLNHNKLLFLDIETVRYTKHYSELDTRTRDLWIKRSKKINPNVSLDEFPSEEDIDLIQDVYESNASFYPEFSKIICISLGAFDNKTGEFKITSFSENDEKCLLEKFIKVSNKLSSMNYTMIAHNGFSFDYPFITKRCIIQGLNPPVALHTFGKKPWDVNILDSLDLWKNIAKFGQTATLDEITNCLGIQSSKDQIDGSKVAEYYFDDKLNDIVAYCEKDIAVLKDVIICLKELK